MIVIRDMQPGDIPALAELYRQFWGESSNLPKMQKKFAQLCEREDYILLCAVDGERLTGSVTGIVCQDLYGDCRPFLVLENMVVDHTCRRKGVAGALLVQLEERARAKGCTQVILVTESAREDALGFYEASGFHPTANKGYKKKL